MTSCPIIVPDKLQKQLSKYRAIVYHYDGMPIDEISNKIKVNKGTISKLIFKFDVYGDVLVNNKFLFFYFSP